jgi:hypothetical protein
MHRSPEVSVQPHSMGKSFDSQDFSKFNLATAFRLNATVFVPFHRIRETWLDRQANYTREVGHPMYENKNGKFRQKSKSMLYS